VRWTPQRRIVVSHDRHPRSDRAGQRSTADAAVQRAVGKAALTDQLPPASTQAGASPAPIQRIANEGNPGAGAASPRPDWIQRLFGHRPVTEPLAVQRRSGQPGSPEVVHEAARSGLATPTTAMPHAGAIQRAFGPTHDVSGIQAHVGGDAAHACDDMNATAFASGHHVVFAGSPDLHTAAHEAAHVVQQAHGVHLAGGVGQVGDPYERHADAVADRVVAGDSAADLLASGPGGSGTAGAVQRKDPAAKSNPEADKRTARHVVFQMADVVRSGYNDDRGAAWYQVALTTLGKAIHGSRSDRAGDWIPGHERLEMFEWSLQQLEPHLALAAKTDPDMRDKIAAEIRPRVAELRKVLIMDDAKDRVEHPELGASRKTARTAAHPDSHNPREQGAALASALPGLIQTMKQTTDRVKTVGELVVKGQLDAHGHVEHELPKLNALAAVLTLATSWLKLSDEEFQHELGHIHGVWNGVSTYSELVGLTVETGSSALVLTASFGGALATLAGDHAAAEASWTLAGKTMAVLEVVLAGIQVVHGVAALFNPDSTRQQRVDGVAELGMGVGALGVAAVHGASAAWIGALPVAGPYYLAMIAAHLYNEAVEGWEIGFVRDGLLPFLRDQGRFISHSADMVANAAILKYSEKDRDSAAAYTDIENREGVRLGEIIDNFLDRCDPDGHNGIGSDFKERSPANYTIVAEHLRPLLGLRGARTPQKAAAAAAQVLDSIRWVFAHATSIVKASARGDDLADMKRSEADDAAHAEGGHE
jgi:hypothetical protein